MGTISSTLLSPLERNIITFIGDQGEAAAAHVWEHFPERFAGPRDAREFLDRMADRGRLRSRQGTVYTRRGGGL